MRLEDGQRMLFIGDSITDCGRARPVGVGAGLGSGYVALVDGLLATGYPERRLHLLNMGVSGDRVTDLARRWERDVLNHAPNWLVVKIGINDVWRRIETPDDPDPVSLDRYTRTYRALLERTRPRLTALVLMSPYVIEADPADPMRVMMNGYGRAVRTLAAEFDALFVDVQAAFDRVLAHRPAHTLSGDRVHPNLAGHLVIARALLDGLGFDWTREE